MSELEALYLEQTDKLARITAALGLAGDESTPHLVTKVRKIVADRQRLISAASAVQQSAKPALGQVYISPVTLHRLEAVIEQARTSPQ